MMNALVRVFFVRVSCDRARENDLRAVNGRSHILELLVVQCLVDVILNLRGVRRVGERQPHSTGEHPE